MICLRKDTWKAGRPLPWRQIFVLAALIWLAFATLAHSAAPQPVWINRAQIQPAPDGEILALEMSLFGTFSLSQHQDRPNLYELTFQRGYLAPWFEGPRIAGDLIHNVKVSGGDGKQLVVEIQLKEAAQVEWTRLLSFDPLSFGIHFQKINPIAADRPKDLPPNQEWDPPELDLSLKGSYRVATMGEGTVLRFGDPDDSPPAPPTPARTQTTSMGGSLEGRATRDLRDKSPSDHDQSYRGIGQLYLDWQPLARQPQPQRTLRLYLSGEADYLYMGRDHANEDFDLDLFEAYVFYGQGPFELQTGKQIVRWGKADQVSPVDNLNPQDLRELITWPTEERKLPVWMVRARWFFEKVTLEGVFLPVFEPSDIEFFDSDWAIYRQVRDEIRRAPLSPDLQSYLLSRGVNRNKPARTLRNSEWGGRITGTYGGWDLGVSFLYTREDMPHTASFPIKNIRLPGTFSGDALLAALDEAILTDEHIEVVYPRQKIYGIEFETTVGIFGLRGESAWFDQATFLRDDLTSTTKPVLHSIAGIDYTGVAGWYTNVQLAHRYIHSFEDSILFFKRHNVSLLGEVSRTALRGRLEAAFKYNLDLHDGGYFLEPSVTAKFINRLDVTLGLHIFGGDDDTFLGYYDDNDQVFLLAKYHF
jgi:hypothetical protein